MVQFSLNILVALRVFIRSRADTALVILALRQRLAVLKRKRPRPPLNGCDRLFWTTLRRLWPGWADVLLMVKPETVVAWHCAGFGLYWRWRSSARLGGRGSPNKGVIQPSPETTAHIPLWLPVDGWIASPLTPPVSHSQSP
jgi:hypothetical protein